MSKLKEKEKTVTKIIEFLKEKEIQLPKDFRKKLIESMSEFYGENSLLSLESIEAVYKICKEWEPFVLDKNEFDKLVCSKVYCMARIHAATINSCPGLKAYIGKICKLKEKVELPNMFVTTATLQGMVTVEGDGFKKSL